ncbi:MAG: DUF3696 domain-containing protein [Candidatus Bipolaricaulis sp.]|nr:DUF3696 domain-containing protein [Candidatus Bipolaricaulis sp.]
MITSLRIRGFKSWADTRELRFGKLTGFFGSNSSGKTGLVQLPLLLKQTAESADRAAVLDLGSKHVVVDIGGWKDILCRRPQSAELSIQFSWRRAKPLSIRAPEDRSRIWLSGTDMRFETRIQVDNGTAEVAEMAYQFQDFRFSMERGGRTGYEIKATGPRKFAFVKSQGRPFSRIPAPVKCYGFPDQVRAGWQNAGFLADLTLEFEQELARLYYLGPLRDYPHREYAWTGTRPSDVGKNGERAVEALIASRVGAKEPGWGGLTLEEVVARWFGTLGLATAFHVEEIAKDTSLYRVSISTSKEAARVLITDVGFGVSQILPVIVLCYYAPRGSTIILEQPEIHLHPAVQMGLADVLVDAIKKRQVQIIVESHSEYLLRRIQRRIAEGRFAASDTSLYFCKMVNGESVAEPLNLDLYGSISNWPRDFFGDEMGEIAEMSKAAGRRRRKVNHSCEQSLLTPTSR